MIFASCYNQRFIRFVELCKVFEDQFFAIIVIHNSFLSEHWHRLQVVFGTKFGCCFGSEESQVPIDIGQAVWLPPFLLASHQFELRVPVNEFQYERSLTCSAWDLTTHTDIAFRFFQLHLLRYFDHFLRIFICGLFQTEDADVFLPLLLLVVVSVEQREQFGALVDWLGRYSPDPRRLRCRTGRVAPWNFLVGAWEATLEPSQDTGFYFRTGKILVGAAL